MMKRLVLCCTAIVFSHLLFAQVPVPAGNGPVKLADVVSAYKKMHPDYGKHLSAAVKALLPALPKEENEENYQFDRWLWYWQQHTDANGYLVSPAKTWQELKNAQQSAKSAARTTSSGVSPAWTFVGPDSSEAQGEGVGRINVVAFHPTDSNTYWVGTPGGGAWKTTNNGMSWTSMTDGLPLLSISDIVFNPLNPNTVYLCTGDRDAGDYPGVGVLKSYDGGATWNTTGISWTPSEYNVANSMIISPSDTNVLILATTAGMYRSHDGGATFVSENSNDFKQVIYRPNDTNIVYATSYINYYSSPVTAAQIWRSADGGVTWTQQTSLSTSDRITLAVTPAAPNTVLAVSSAYDPSGSNQDGLDGIYKSTDKGVTYSEIYTGGCTGNLLTWDAGGAGCGGQGWYTLPLAISPLDANMVITGGVNSWESTDGGYTWSLLTQWSFQESGITTIHADKHWMAFNPLTPSRFFETNDGGIYSTYAPITSTSWNDLTNRMGIEEIYRLSVSDIANFAISGAQDVGTKISRPGGVFEEAVGGDGMACLLNFGDSTVAYGSSEYGYFNRIDPTAPAPYSTGTDISSSIGEGTGGWVTPIASVPSCSSCIMIGYTSIFESPDEGSTWNEISPVLTSNTLYRIATSIADPNTIFATDNYTQNVYYTHDGGVTWNTMTAPYAGYQYISDIKTDPRDINHIWATYSGYDAPQVVEWNASTGWQMINTGLTNIPVLCFAIDTQSRDMYIGTEIGVYYRDSTMAAWEPFNTGLPSIEVTDLEIKYSTNELWASTYGRSIWKSPKHSITTTDTTADTTTGVSIVPFSRNGIVISPNPNHGTFTASVKNIADGQVAMRLTDDAGKTAWKGSGIISGGKINVNAAGLAAGTYIFEIDARNVVEGKQKVLIY